MADNITPAQVPVVENLEYIPGFDASGNWAKMRGKKIANAAAAAELAQAASEVATEAIDTADAAKSTADAAKSTAEGIAGTAQTAKNTADSALAAANSSTAAAQAAAATAIEAKATADGIAGTANDAKTQSEAAVQIAASAKTAAEKNDGLLSGAMIWPNAGTVRVYTGNFVDGLYDPLQATGQVSNGKFRSLVLTYATTSSRSFILKSLSSYLGSAFRGELTVTVVGGAGLQIYNDTATTSHLQGMVLPFSTNLGSGSLYVFKILITGADYAVVECLYNCRFSPTAAAPSVAQIILPGGGGATGEASGDLAGYYPAPTIKESVKLTGLPTADTPDLSLLNKQIANTEFVKTFPKKWAVAKNVVRFDEDDQYFYVQKGFTSFAIASMDGEGLQVPTIGDSSRVYRCHILSNGNTTLTIVVYFADGYVDKSLTFSGLGSGSITLIEILIVLDSYGGYIYGRAAGQLAVA